MQMSVRSFVRLMKSVLELTKFIFLYQVCLWTVSGQSQVISVQFKVSLMLVSGQSQVSLCLLCHTDGA